MCSLMEQPFFFLGTPMSKEAGQCPPFLSFSFLLPKHPLFTARLLQYHLYRHHSGFLLPKNLMHFWCCVDFLRVCSYQSARSEMMPLHPPLHPQAVKQLREAGGGAHGLSSVPGQLSPGFRARG